MTIRIFTSNRFPIAAIALAGCLISLTIHAEEASSDASSSSKVHPVAETKKVVKAVGHGVKETTKVIGHAARDGTRAVGHKTREVTKEIGHATRDEVNELKK